MAQTTVSYPGQRSADEIEQIAFSIETMGPRLNRTRFELLIYQCGLDKHCKVSIYRSLSQCR